MFCWLLQEVNATVAQATGGRLTLGEMDTEGVERWVDQKKAQVRCLVNGCCGGGATLQYL